MPHLTGILIVLIGCSMIFGIIYITTTASNREHMAMIEAGMNPKSDRSSSYSRLRIGMLVFLVPVGILVGNYTHTFFNMEAEPAAVVFAFLFGGIALLSAYFVTWALGLENKDEEEA